MRKSRIITVILFFASIGLCMSAIADIESTAPLSSVGAQVKETGLGDLTADAFISVSGAQIALIPAGSFKEITIPKGSIAPPTIIACLQYPDDLLTVIEITGTQVVRALERSVSLYPQKNMGFIQVSGVSFTYNPKAPKNSRIISVKVGNDKLDNNSVYRAVTTKPFANGAYGYFTIWGRDKDKIYEMDKTSAQAVTDYLSRKTTLDYSRLNRITQGK
ncbi:MAG: 5'-nucleotidase C-terminal domain-containing protein [Armatimonadota bacterium]